MENRKSNHRPEVVVHHIATRLHNRWRLAVCLPLIYIMAGVLLKQHYFDAHRSGEGLLPLGESTLLILLFISGTILIFLWYLVDKLDRRFLGTIHQKRHDPEACFDAALNTQLAQFLACDLASLPGMLLFVFQADLFLLAAFCLASLVLYLRAMPSEYRMGRAMLTE